MGCPLSPSSKQTGPADGHPASRRSAPAPQIQGVGGHLDPQKKVSLGWESSSPTLAMSDLPQMSSRVPITPGLPNRGITPTSGLVSRAMPFVGG